MSLPILYAKGTTTFTNIGIGVLTDCLKCEVTREINGEYELTMEYPVDGVHFSDIQLECIITAKVPDKEAWQAFKIYSMSKPIDMTVTIDAEHITYMTGDIPLIPFSIQEGGIDGILAALSTIAIPTGVTSPFTFTDTLPEDATVYTLKEPASLREVMSDMDGMLLSKDFYENCEWDYDNYNIVLTNGIGSDRSNSIKYVYGVNVSDLSQNESLTNTITGIMPYVHAEDDDGVPVNRIGNIRYGTGYQSFANQRIEPVDVESYFTDTEKEQWQKDPATGIKMPTIEAVTAKGEDAIKDFDFVCKPEVSFTINPVDLTGISGYEEVAENLKRVRLGDIIGIIFEQYGIETTARIIRVTYDILNETNTSVDVGDAKPSLAATLASIGDKVEVNRAGIVINRDSIISYVNREDGKLGTRIQQTENMISSTVYGEMTAWNMVPITGSHQYTGGEEWTIQLYSKGDPSTWYNAGSEYDGYKYFDNLTGAVWYCHQVSGVWQWDHCTWTYDHGRVASGTDTQMRAAANEDHWMYSWYNTSDNKVYYLERSESGGSYTYTWVLKDPQEIQLTGHNAYAERMDVTSYSNITQTSNQIVLKVDSNGHMALCELTESPDGHSQFNVLADDINFDGHTFNLSADNMTIVSDTTVIDEDGYVVYYLCNSSDVGAVPLAGGLYYNKKITMAFQDGDAGWSLEDRSMNAFSELRGNNFIIEQLYDKTDWTPINDTYLNDQSSFPGKTKAYLSMNPRWFGMYHKNDQLSDTHKFDYRLGHFLQNGEVSETVGKIDQWWSGDSNPQNPDEAMFLMEKPDEASESFAMMVYDQIIMAGGKYTSKQSPRMFRIRSKIDPNTNTVMRYNQFGVSDYFYKKAPYQINGKPMYALTNDASSISAGDNLEDGCFVIVYDGPEREKELISVTLYGGMGDTITIRDEDNQLIATVVFATGAGSSVYQSRDLDKFATYRFTSSIYSYTVEHTIETASDTVEVIPASVKWLRVADFPVATVGDATDDTVCIAKRGLYYKGKIYAVGMPCRVPMSNVLQVPVYAFDGTTWAQVTTLTVPGTTSSSNFYTMEIVFAIYNDKLRIFMGDYLNSYAINFNMYVFDGTTWERIEKDYYGKYFPKVRFAMEYDGLLYMVGNGGIFAYNDATGAYTAIGALPFDNGQYQANNNWGCVSLNGECHLFYRWQKYYNTYPYRHVILDLPTGSITEVLESEIWSNRGMLLSSRSNVMVEYNGKILNFTNTTTQSQAVEQYNPATNSWSYFTDGIPYQVQALPCPVVNGNKLYLIGSSLTNRSADQSLENVYKYRG